MSDSSFIPSASLLAFLKALADANRLKIVGLLAQRPHSVEELAALLGLRPSTISHHLSRLAEAGLVSARAESYYNMYTLEKGVLERIARQLLSQEVLPAVAQEVDVDAYARKVVRDYLKEDGSLKAIPAQRKKLAIILHHLVQSFEVGREYKESEVNEILRAFHPDTASLRRELVGFKLMQRSRGMYWRSEENEP
jgi:DNA-binding HxlR family transcriptional regulator